MTRHKDILIALRRITRAIDLHSRKLMKSSGLTAPQLVVLQCIAEGTAETPSAIARDVSLSQATVTAILDRLQKNGLTRREKSPTDRRSVVVTLTPEGQATLDDAPELLQAGFLREFSKLALWEQTGLISALQRVAELMDADDVDAAPILQVGDIRTPLPTPPDAP